MTKRRKNNFNGRRIVSWVLCMIAAVPQTKYPTNRWRGLKGGEMKWYYDGMGD